MNRNSISSLALAALLAGALAAGPAHAQTTTDPNVTTTDTRTNRAYDDHDGFNPGWLGLLGLAGLMGLKRRPTRDEHDVRQGRPAHV